VEFIDNWYVLGTFKTPSVKFHEHLFRVRVVACGLVDRPADVAKLLDSFLLLFVANAQKGYWVSGHSVSSHLL
jgi:hypothetical protein